MESYEVIPSREIHGDEITRKVYINGEFLDPSPSQKVWNHSPDGFSWGYEGSGPAQLALALLLAFGVDDKIAARWHQGFKRDIVARLHGNFDLKLSDVQEWIENQYAAEKRDALADPLDVAEEG